MDKCNLHTILRLPTGIFYAHGVKTNVFFFTRGKTNINNTKGVWIYDMRTNMPKYGKRTPLMQEHFSDFIKCYGSYPKGLSRRKASDSKQGRWKKFSIKEIKAKDYKLDSFKWIEDKSIERANDILEPSELAIVAISELEEVVSELNLILAALEDENE